MLSLASLWFRAHVESRNRAVGIAVDYDLVQSLGAAQGLSPTVALSHLKDAGANVIVLPEDTVGGLIANGDADILPGRLRMQPGSDAARVVRGLRVRFPRTTIRLQRAGNSVDVVFNSLPRDQVRTTGIGLDPSAVSYISKVGLHLIGRYGNPSGASSEAVQATVHWAKEQGVECFLPLGDQVLGRKDSLPDFIDALKASGMYYASAEFAKIAGDANVVSSVPDLTIRLHAAQVQELDRMPLAEAVERYSKAARERNQRLLLLRPLSMAGPAPLDGMADFVAAVKKGIAKDGMVVGRPVPFKDSGVPPWILALLSLSIAPVVYWAGATLIVDSRLRLLGALLIAGIAMAGMRSFGRPYAALMAATTFPIVAFMVLDKLRPKRWLGAYLVVSAISLVGGLCLAGLLNGLPFFVRADEFKGVKLAHFLPVVAAGALFFARYCGGWGALKSSIKWNEALIAIGSLAVFALLVSRTGNDNPAAVSDVELKFRSLLDVLLYVRPRTKEFLLGHPAMVLGLGMYCAALAQRKTFASRPVVFVSLLAAGAIGQTSMVNTMAHLHTPVLLSLARIGVGWVAGGIIGSVLWLFFDRRASRIEEA